MIRVLQVMGFLTAINPIAALAVDEIDIALCAAYADDQQRLECYDNLAKNLNVSGNAPAETTETPENQVALENARDFAKFDELIAILDQARRKARACEQAIKLKKELQKCEEFNEFTALNSPYHAAVMGFKDLNIRKLESKYQASVFTDLTNNVQTVNTVKRLHADYLKDN